MAETPELTGLERAVAQAREDVEALRERKRALTFREAGIDTTTGVGKGLFDVYDGPSDTDEIRNFAARFGVVDPTEGNDDE